MVAKLNFTQFAQLLNPIIGLDINRYDEFFLQNSLEKRIRETCCDSLEDYCSYLEQNQDERDIFVNSLHVHYSEFFRDPLTFALLDRIILPELILKKKTHRQKEIRIWSTCCAAGQEAYSIAILLEEAISKGNAHLNYRIFATDIDENQLDEARSGVYKIETLKNINLKHLHTWFTHQGESYIVHPALRQHIDFSRFDLLENERRCPPVSIFGDFDLVFCCNLLIYYQPQYRSLILDKFLHCLKKDGCLVTDESERAIALAHAYYEAYPSAAIYRIKQGKEKDL